MLEIKTFFSDWTEVTREVAENFYKHFYECATAIKWEDRLEYFNKKHIRGGHVLWNGKVETDEEKELRMFEHYKNDLIKLAERDNKTVRFNCIEYVCNTPKINPYKMAASILGRDIKILYNDSSITQSENKAKEQKVNKLLKEVG